MNKLNLPHHLAIIMDGNGRWAQARHKPRTFGHIKGTRVAKKIITECSRLGIKHLTLYAFSTENWLRPQVEVSFLMKLLQRYLKKETQNLIKENIRLNFIGNETQIPPEVLKSLHSSMEATSHCTGLNLVFALSYGSRQEIITAVKKIGQKIKSGDLTLDQIDNELMDSCLYTHGTPDPDLIIRTSGELRLSNFLLWQAAYSEFYFSEILWPDFSYSHLCDALNSFTHRKRRFGKAEEELNELPLN